MQDYVHVNKYHVQGVINNISSKMTALDDYTTYQTIPVMHKTKNT